MYTTTIKRSFEPMAGLYPKLVLLSRRRRTLIPDLTQVRALAFHSVFAESGRAIAANRTASFPTREVGRLLLASCWARSDAEHQKRGLPSRRHRYNDRRQSYQRIAEDCRSR